VIREEALELVHEWTKKSALITHMLAVESVMRLVAGKYGQDADQWGLAGLLHDFDYERHGTVPEHPVNGAAVLKERGVAAEVIEAILGHANLSEHPRTSLMAKALFAVDELTGLVMAVTYVRPSRSIEDVEISSVKKKMKDKTFAAGVSRDDIRQGAAELDIELDELIGWVIEGLRSNAGALGLAGDH
jgi:putative nucleotidyltransferase with HDIG domain